MADPTITTMRQVDFYRERATMCSNDVRIAAQQIERLLQLMFGTAATQHLNEQQLVTTAAALRRRMRRCPLVLIKQDLINSVEAALDDMTTDELDALPPPPPDTIFGFERPLVFDLPPQPGTKHDDCTEDECQHGIASMLMSIIVPINSRELVFDEEEPMAAFAGYNRLADQIAVCGNTPGDPATHAIQRLHHHRQVWVPAMFYPMEQDLGGHVSMTHMLKLAMHRATRPASTTPPREAQRTAQAAQVHPKAARAVRTIELAPRYHHTTATSTGTGQPLRWRSSTIGHWRHYRNPDGTLRKKQWIEPFTRGNDKPPRPPEQRPGTVKVAREPKGPQ